MILSDRDIKKAIHDKQIIITPEPDYSKQLGSVSLDLRLGDKISKIKSQKSTIHIKNQTIILPPGEFCLGITKEYIELPDDLCGTLHGRSSLGRKGLMIHSTAPLIDAGFRGRIVLELYNSGPEPVELTIGMRICALTFEKLTSPAEVPYYKKKSARYAGQKKP